MTVCGGRQPQIRRWEHGRDRQRTTEMAAVAASMRIRSTSPVQVTPTRSGALLRMFRSGRVLPTRFLPDQHGSSTNSPEARCRAGSMDGGPALAGGHSATSRRVILCRSALPQMMDTGDRRCGLRCMLSLR